jgi:membrane associated rhomboid family serine protease
MKAAARTFIVAVTAVDLAMYLVEIAFGLASPQGLSMLAPPTCVLAELGAGFTPAIVGPKHEVWRLVTPMFLHGGPLHIAANMYVQLLSGLRCEYEWGTAPTALCYFVSGVGGGLLSAVASPDTVSVGASGAIVGLIGCRASQLVCEWGERDPRVRGQQAWQVVTFLLVLAALGTPSATAGAATCGSGGVPSTGALPGTDLHIDNYAHGGGLLAGVLVGFVLWSSNPTTCCCADRLPLPFLNPAQPRPLLSQRDRDEDEGDSWWCCGLLTATRRLQQLGAWIQTLSRMQRTALLALVAYFTVLSCVLFTMEVPDRVIRC